MRFPILLTLGSLLILSQLALAEVKVEGPKQVDPYKIVRLQATGDVKGAALIWDITNESRVDAEELGTRFLFTAPPGTYQIKLRAIRFEDGTTRVETARATVVIGDKPTPEPGPDPEPPNPPNPPPGPAPIPADGFRVLMLYQDSDLNRYTPEQRATLHGEQVHAYVARKCVKASDGTPEFRCLDRDAKLDNVPPLLQDAIRKVLTTTGFDTPWLVVSNGKGGYSGPLPKTLSETMKIMKQYGGE